MIKTKYSDKPKLDAFDVVGIDATPIIICAETGILYTSQSGGIGCSHPFTEGFVLPYSNIFEDFDDCGLGCHYISFYDEFRGKVAEAFDEYCRKKKISLKFRFDYSRLKEVEEGWIPIIINGFLIDIENEFKEQKAILVTGNCD